MGRTNLIILQNLRRIKKVIMDFDQSFKRLVLPSTEISMHVFDYWMKGMVRYVEKENTQHVELWYVTKENISKNY